MTLGMLAKGGVLTAKVWKLTAKVEMLTAKVAMLNTIRGSKVDSGWRWSLFVVRHSDWLGKTLYVVWNGSLNSIWTETVATNRARVEL